MDLNALYYHHQTAIMNRVNLQATSAGASQFDLVAYYAKRIRSERSRLGVAKHGWTEPALGSQTPMPITASQGI